MAGAFVVCDRFADSTRAYQGTRGQLDPRYLRALERVTLGDVRPGLTLILDLPAAEGLARAAARRGAGEAADRFEREDLEFHESLRAAFLSGGGTGALRPRIDAARAERTSRTRLMSTPAHRSAAAKQAKAQLERWRPEPGIVQLIV